MDANKLAVLQKIDYKIPACCGLCRHANIDAPSEWGTCTQFSYVHQKHVGPPRELSINRHGVCRGFERIEDVTVKLGGYSNMIVETVTS